MKIAEGYETVHEFLTGKVQRTLASASEFYEHQ